MTFDDIGVKNIKLLLYSTLKPDIILVYMLGFVKPVTWQFMQKIPKFFIMQKQEQNAWKNVSEIGIHLVHHTIDSYIRSLIRHFEIFTIIHKAFVAIAYACIPLTFFLLTSRVDNLSFLGSFFDILKKDLRTGGKRIVDELVGRFVLRTIKEMRRIFVKLRFSKCPG